MSKPLYFHHPDISLPVIRRRTNEALLDMLFFYGELLCTRGWSLRWSSCFPSRTSYYAAVSRLRKSGVIAYRREKDAEPVLQLSDDDYTPREVFHPERFWKHKWQGSWNVLVYDVPESQRAFRDGIRRFLVRLRMGCLQKSVWISPRDIRPDYDDLVQSVGVDYVSYLFEARTVLGRQQRDLVLDAWNFDRLREYHNWYIALCKANAGRLNSGGLRREEIEIMASEELTAYITAMEKDPLLPRELHPSFYKGRQVFDLHKAFVTLVRKRLRHAQ